MTEEKTLTREERRAVKMEERIKKLSTLRGMEDIDEIVGYVYRDNISGKRTALPPVRAFLEDDRVGHIYGPGEYSIVYKFQSPGSNSEECVTISYSIGPEYAQLHREFCAQNGQPCYLDSRTAIPGIQQNEGIGSILNEEKIKGIIGLLGAIKMMMGNDNQSNDLRVMLDSNTKLLASAIGAKNQSPFGNLPEQLFSTTFTKMLEKPEQPNPAKIIKEQFDLFQSFEAMRNPNLQVQREQEESERNKSPIEKTIDKVLEHLPSFLERFNGDEKAAAQQLKKEHPEAHLLRFKPEYAKALYVATAEKYGITSADRWALGLGLDPSKYRHFVTGEVHTIPALNPARPQQKTAIKFR